MDRIVGSIGGEGLPRLPINISPRYGGDSRDAVTWILCDSPLLAYTLVMLDRGVDPEVDIDGQDAHRDDQRQWYRCVTSSLLGFQAPGR